MNQCRFCCAGVVGRVVDEAAEAREIAGTYVIHRQAHMEGCLHLSQPVGPYGQ